jgi:hypothetical protein
LLALGQRPSAQQKTDLPVCHARHATKRGYGWEGYKVHALQTCDDATEVE